MIVKCYSFQLRYWLTDSYSRALRKITSTASSS